jgi:alkanesulfonate monooxygenase SsuD/methylene tetrahydromethanopterin reductase-like flavin-dependent oxidoreductase (luciferase family)
LRSGDPGKLPPPITGYRESLPPAFRAMASGLMTGSAIGSPASARRQLHAFLERTQADELMICGSIFDRDARRRSLTMAADLLDTARERIAA